MKKIKTRRIVYIVLVSVFVISSYFFRSDTRGLLIKGEYKHYVSELKFTDFADNGSIQLGVILFLPILIISFIRISEMSPTELLFIYSTPIL